jgi:fatty-acyl-CoA synthase
VDDDGFIYIAGRAKDMLITGGLNVYPAEVERVIAEHPAVHEAAIIGLPDDQWGKSGTPWSSCTLAANSLSPNCSTTSAPSSPSTRSRSDSPFARSPPPWTTSGKVQKFVVREQVDLAKSRA